MFRKYLMLLAVATVGSSGVVQAAQVAPAGAKAEIVNLKDGDTVKSPVVVKFGLSGMGVAPAGVVKENTGHFHLLVDAAALPAAEQAISSDKAHMHFGGGQIQTTVELTPGKHTLQLEMADQTHVPFNPPVVSDKITITVQ